jgi:hypothetical protein
MPLYRRRVSGRNCAADSERAMGLRLPSSHPSTELRASNGLKGLAGVRRRAACNLSLPGIGIGKQSESNMATRMDTKEHARTAKIITPRPCCGGRRLWTAMRTAASSDGSSVPEAQLNSGPVAGGRPTGMTDAGVADQARGRNGRQSARGLRDLRN